MTKSTPKPDANVQLNAAQREAAEREEARRREDTASLSAAWRRGLRPDPEPTDLSTGPAPTPQN